MKCRRSCFAAAALVAVASLASSARAEDADAGADVSVVPAASEPHPQVVDAAGPATSAQPSALPPPSTVSPATAPSPSPASKRTPPDEVPGVPNPSPVVLGGTPTPHDTVGKPLEWKWARFGTADYIVTITAAGLTLAAAIIQPGSSHKIEGGILFDDSVRKALRASDLQTRYAFRDASDVGLSLAVTWPFFVDALATTWWYRGSRDAAAEMALLDLETLAVSGAVQGVTNVLVSRPRPYTSTCGTAELPSTALDCTGASPADRSFFSGHSAFSFTSAALICGNHMKNDLLGGPWDALSCGGGYLVAATTATFRVVADMHYASDVITGALLGTLIGYGVPFLHYKHRDLGAVRAGSLRLQLVPSPSGAGVVGVF